MTTEVLSSLAYASDPLVTGLRLACEAPSEADRIELARETLARYGHAHDVPAIREMSRLAASMSHAAHTKFLSHLDSLKPGEHTPAERWMRAVLLEALAHYSEAASAYEAVPDDGFQEARAARLLAQSRALVKAERWVDAGAPVRGTIAASESFHTIQVADRLLARIQQHSTVPSKHRGKIAMIGTTTLDFFAPVLHAICFAAGIDAQIYTGGFSQYQQDVLDPSSNLAAFDPDVVIIAAEWRSLGLPDESDNPDQVVNTTISMLRTLWTQCRERLGAYVIQHNFETPLADPYGNLSVALEGGRGRILRRINLGLWMAAKEEPGVAILDLDGVAAAYGKQSWSDPTMWHSAKQYPSTGALPLLVRHQVALLSARFGLNAKCLVLDLDNTLWGGEIGEDGLGGIDLGATASGEAFLDFQRYIRSLRNRGIILAVCSKNNLDDAETPFREHPEMALHRDDFSAFFANWQPKDDNLRSIAHQLNIGLDSLVFVDDSPRERAWIRYRLPEVRVPEMPADPAGFVRALDRELYFESFSLTPEDRERTTSYLANSRRAAVEAQSTSIEDFLAGLSMHVELRPFEEGDLPRITQLIDKTNQFNVTTRRHSENDVRNLMRCPEAYTQSMQLEDRFGNNGLTGVLIAVPDTDSLRIDTWLMSCRVLKRRVDQVMLTALIRYTRGHGWKTLRAEYIPTLKNDQVRSLFDELGFRLLEQQPDGIRKYELGLLDYRDKEIDFCKVVDLTQRGPLAFSG